jgi:ferredoxin
MKALIPIILLTLVTMAFGSLTYSQESGGGLIEWDPVELSFESLVLRCAQIEYDAGDPDWGVPIATVNPDSSGEFPTSVSIPAAFVVDPDKCIACGICISQCPTAAISADVDGIAVIDPGLCIACGICSSVCPVDAIFAPSSNLYYGLFGVDEEGIEEFIQGSVQ